MITAEGAWGTNLVGLDKRATIVQEHRERTKTIILKESNLTQSYLLRGLNEVLELDSWDF